MIYLDNAATTRVSEDVVNEMLNCFRYEFANVSSNHSFAKKTLELVNTARKRVSSMIGASESEIYFTSGSSEGINTILRGFVEYNISKGDHIITSKIEHKAVIETCKYLESIGVNVTYLDVDENGLISLEELKSAINSNTILVSIIWVNNETGICQDLNSIGNIVSNSEAKLFVDATQVVGKIGFDVSSLKIDLLTLSGHKFHGPKGVGAIFVKEGIKLNPLIYGGGQEKGLRSGTLNVPGIVGLGKASVSSVPDIRDISKLRNYLELQLETNFDCFVIGKNVERSPYISNVIFKNQDSEVLINKLKKTVVSTGSACTSEINEPSYVLKEMGISDELAFGSVRFSLSKYTTENEIDAAIQDFKNILRPKKTFKEV